jgi:hypothetical protein
MSQTVAHSGKARASDPQVAKSVTDAPLSTDQMAEQLRTALSHMAGGEQAPAPPNGAPVGAAAVVMHAKRELSLISGLEADRVSSVINEPDGWHVTVDLIELSRIPHSTDVIAAYDAVFAPDGTLQSYHRRRRYLRDQMTEDE